MPSRLSSLVTSVAADGKVTPEEVDQLITTARSNGVVSRAEKRALKAALGTHGSKFEPAARSKLETFLGGGAPQPETAGALATRRLDEARPDGLSGAELAAAEKAIAERYGPKVAREALEQALGARFGELAVDGVTWLQQHHGSLDGHIDRFQQVLATHLKDAKLIDANFDGRLDEHDKLWVNGADGRVNVTTVGAALRDRLKIGEAMISSCEDMNGAKHQFALIKDHSFNSALWDSQGGGSFKPKAGVKPSAALADIFADPSKYKFECATALVIVHYQAMLELLGPRDFDTVCANLRVGPWDYESTMGTYWRSSGGSVDATPARQAELRAGDYTYFKNWDVSDTGRAAGWQGENVISLGNGMYYGHPFGIATGQHIVDYLNQNRNAGSTRSASMLELQARFDSSLLALDKHPGE